MTAIGLLSHPRSRLDGFLSTHLATLPSSAGCSATNVRTLGRYCHLRLDGQRPKRGVHVVAASRCDLVCVVSGLQPRRHHPFWLVETTTTKWRLVRFAIRPLYRKIALVESRGISKLVKRETVTVVIWSVNQQGTIRDAHRRLDSDR
jgi:hypothetical protein